jgi:FlaA1/EpsC-like NDP-sugar epimerase
MARIPKREYLTLLVGDLLTFGISLWVTLALRSAEVPTYERYVTHLVPFSVLFIAWVFIFFLAGLYAKYTRLMRSKLPALILYTQTLNIVIAAAFFFLVPLFGIAPKTILAIYLVVSSLLIFVWRVLLFPLVRPKDRAKAVLLGTGDEIHDIKREINGGDPYQVPYRLQKGTGDHH